MQRHFFVVVAWGRHRLPACASLRACAIALNCLREYLAEPPWGSGSNRQPPSCCGVPLLLPLAGLNKEGAHVSITSQKKSSSHIFFGLADPLEAVEAGDRSLAKLKNSVIRLFLSMIL